MAVTMTNPIEYISRVQQSIVTDQVRVKLVNGCAGSRKTDTIVKLGAYHVITKRHNVLFLTLVSSITHELKCRLESLLGIEIPKVGISNHYIGEYMGCKISIANFDAFVHRQLETLGLDEELSIKGDCHDWKTRTLCDATHNFLHTDFYMKDGTKADMVLVDEFQDMDPLKAKILVNILKHNQDKFGIAVGDMVQSVFPKAVSTDLAIGHPMNIWKSSLNPAVYHIETCYRCPRAHVQFVSSLLGEYYDKYAVPLMVSHDVDDINKPVVFTHDRISKNQGAYAIACQVSSAIRELFRHDDTLKPRDVAIIMKKSNSNHVFEQLKIILNKTYQVMGFEADSIIHFETRGDGYHNSIDWSKADKKTVLLSIHGDKGKGHKVVFFLGLTHKSIPSENNVFKTAELIDVSLVNVALTRSTKYLFVGFTYDSPSRYLCQKSDNLHDNAYIAWNSHDWCVMPDSTRDAVDYLPGAPPTPYREVILAMNQSWASSTNTSEHIPNFGREMRITPLMCPDKDIIRVRDDIARDLSSTFETLFCREDMKPVVTEFGEKSKFKSVIQEDMMPMIGIMGELLVYRYMHLHHAESFLRKTFSCIMSHDHVEYTDDDRILNIVTDFGINQLVRDIDAWKYMVRQIFSIYSSFFEKDEGIRLFFGKLLVADRPVVVLSSVFSTKAFRQQLRVFLGKTESPKIPTRVFWNMALCFNELCESLRRPCVLLHFNRFHENIDNLHQNVYKFCKMYLAPKASTICFQANHRIIEKEENPDVLGNKFGFVNHEDLDADRYQRGYMYGIIGRSDIVDTDSGGMVYELKTSGRVDMSREWIAQALVYCCLPCFSPNMPNLPISFTVVNLLNGIAYAYKVPEWFDNKVMIESILKEYKYHSEMIGKIIQKL